MTTAFQIGAFQFDAFQEERVGSGGSSFRPLSGWGLRYWLEVHAAAARRKQEAEARAIAERKAYEAEEQRLREEPVLVRLALKTAGHAPVLDVDAELEEFHQLMKMVAEIDDEECAC